MRGPRGVAGCVGVVLAATVLVACAESRGSNPTQERPSGGVTVPNRSASPEPSTPTPTHRLRLPSSHEKPTPTRAPSRPEPTSPVGGTDLTIEFDDGHAVTTWRLTCAPAGGTHPTAALACRALAEHGATALPPVPKGRYCAMIYGGPQRARITGTWQGRRVDSTLSRTNGCEIARWDALTGLLPGGGA